MAKTSKITEKLWDIKECPPINCLINPKTLMPSKKKDDGMLSICITGGETSHGLSPNLWVLFPDARME